MDKIFYLDNTATTKCFDEVVDCAKKYLRDDFYNPSAVYDKSVAVKRDINYARKIVLDSLGSNSGELIFTGSATEANNTIILSQKNIKGKKYLFGEGEHPSVMQCAKLLELRGYNVQYVPLDREGCVDVLKFQELVKDGDVAFISVQHVSNETGAINPISKLVKIAKMFNPKVLFHSDGVQAFMKFDYSVLDLNVDFYTISAHKIHGPKGVGAFYVKNDVRFVPYIIGGGQEKGMRSGTENVFGIMAFSIAVEKIKADKKENLNKVSSMKDELLKELKAQSVVYKIHGSGIPHILSVCLSDKVRGETLVHALERRGVYISTGSACSSTKHMNQTLEAMGVDKEEILSSVRISFSPYMDFDAKIVAGIIKEELDKLEVRSYE